MMPRQLNYYQITKKFFRPLSKKYRFLTISASVIVGVALYIGVDIVLAEVVRQNSYDIHMLASELLTEAGPYKNASTLHAEMVRQYSQLLESRHLGSVLRVLYPTYSPQKVLASALTGLEKATDNEEAREAIWKAGVQSNQLYLLGNKFPRSPVAWFDTEYLPQWWLEDLDRALAESGKLVNTLEGDQTVENAKAACEANRRTVLLLFPAVRLDPDKEEVIRKVREFLGIVKRAQEYTNTVANKEKDVSAKVRILAWVRSEDRRVKILEAMLSNNMDEVCELLREAVEEAFKEKQAPDSP